MSEEEIFNLLNHKVLKPPKNKILQFIKKKGGATIDDISSSLSLPATSVRQHISSLERDQLIRTLSIKQATGRPKILYTLTEMANNLFPKRFDFLLSMIIAEIERIDGPEKIDLIFSNISENILCLCEGALEGKSIEEKLYTMISLVRAWGSMAEIEKIDTNEFVIKEYNCDFYNSTLKYNLLSRFAMIILQKILTNANLNCKIETDKSSGVDSCSFYIKCPD